MGFAAGGALDAEGVVEGLVFGVEGAEVSYSVVGSGISRATWARSRRKRVGGSCR